LIDLGFSTVPVVERTALGLNNVKREAQGIHEKRGGLGGVQDEHTRSLRRQASGPGVEGAGARAGDKIPSTARASPGRGEGTWSGRIRGFSDQRLVKLVEILEAVNPKAVRATRD
jgi:hypothetical protein